MDFKEIYQKEHLENHLSYPQIREKYNISRGTWDYYIRYKLGLKSDRRKHKANDFFFDNLDSEEKAYMLGFFYADGYLASDGRMGCRLKRDDIEIIELFKKYIAIESPLEYTNNQNIKRSPQVSIRWKSEHMYNRLKNIGFNVDKTHTDSNVFSFIPDNLKDAFIRGFCDGDGNVGFKKCTKGGRQLNWYRTSITFSNGTKTVLEDIQKYLEKFNIKGILYNKNSYFVLYYGRAYDATKLAKMLYTNASIYLKRKYDAAINMINYRTNTELTKKTKRFLVV